MKNPSTISSGESDERAAVPADLHEFKVRLSEYGVAMYHGQGEKACVLSEVLESMFEGAALATQPAESKACASVGVGPTKRIDAETISLAARAWADWLKTNDAPINAASRETLAGVLSRWVASLATPATSVGEPVADPLQGAADWLKSGLIDVTVADIQSRLLIGYNRARRLFDGATPPAAPAATEAPSDAIHICPRHDLTIVVDPKAGCPDCNAERATPAPAVGASDWLPIEGAPKDGRTLLLGYFNSAGKWRTLRGQWMSADYIAQNWEEPDEGEPGWYETVVESDDMPNAWRTNPTHYQLLPKEPGASVQPAAGALPPVRWWSGVVGSPEKLANLLDGYSEKKESPRRDERVMRAAAKWIREVGASVQPVLASLSDEQIDAVRCGAQVPQSTDSEELRWTKAHARTFARAVLALASSTPSKGGQTS